MLLLTPSRQRQIFQTSEHYFSDFHWLENIFVISVHLLSIYGIYEESFSEQVGFEGCSEGDSFRVVCVSRKRVPVRV